MAWITDAQGNWIEVPDPGATATATAPAKPAAGQTSMVPVPSAPENPEVTKAQLSLFSNIATGILTAGGQIGAAILGSGSRPSGAQSTFFGQQQPAPTPASANVVPGWVWALGAAAVAAFLLWLALSSRKQES